MITKAYGFSHLRLTDSLIYSWVCYQQTDGLHVSTCRTLHRLTLHAWRAADRFGRFVSDFRYWHYAWRDGTGDGAFVMNGFERELQTTSPLMPQAISLFNQRFR